MKNWAFIVSFLFLFLSTIPCSDGFDVEDKCGKEIGLNRDHQKDSDDACPITCICNCCGMTIAYEPIKAFHLDWNIEIPTSLIGSYTSNYIFNYFSNIWQPPQLIN
ncbi:DUF6660 family protein [Galbibacter mesophilus]|uniref:DUF6660 family protein n=1 Tax=Galbibacter mesophilus TaxID=379069 RepID=UPI00191E21C8|nr:DUF6660 family protein [Galbibacter mesophilus]MCM5663708.1 hypothetical protein [Galbibacter mesophilus]